MIDLTPLDVRKKKGDFRRGLRGYDPPHVDDFLDIVADRMEALVRENNSLQERVAKFEQQTAEYREREKALTETLVTAQEMREEIRAQTAREADMARRQAEQEAGRIKGDAQRAREREEDTLRRLRAKQLEFVQTYRSFLERELAELASLTRGLELNGTVADAGRTPERPDAARGAPDAGRPAERPGRVEWSQPSAPAAQDDEWATSSPTPPARPERTAFAAGMSGPAKPPQAPKAEPPPARPKAAGAKGPDSDAFGPEFADLTSGDLPPGDDEAVDLALDTQSLIGSDLESAGPAAAKTPPPASRPPAKDSGDLGLDLVPELEDFSEFGDLGIDADDDFGMLPPVKPAKPASNQKPGAPASPPKKPAVQDDDDDDDLLKSLFGEDP